MALGCVLKGRKYDLEINTSLATSETNLTHRRLSFKLWVHGYRNRITNFCLYLCIFTEKVILYQLV